jgi:nitrite reductase/ring-hydroxylating ferredoxin subunit
VQGRFGPLQVDGFAYRAADGAVRAWLNLCPHRSQPVDVGDGRLFNGAGELECPAHGARFDASSGGCVGGPCVGRPLSAVFAEERDGSVWIAARPTAAAVE